MAKIYVHDIIDSLKFYYYVKPFGINKLSSLKNTQNISIFSSPRGGSTWLAQTLASLLKGNIVWEPLFYKPSKRGILYQAFKYPERYALDFKWNPYLPEDVNHEKAFRFFSRLFSKEIVNLELYRYNDLKLVCSKKWFVYKFCYGNNLLPWLVNRFEIKPILLLRHPCAVVASQLHHGA